MKKILFLLVIAIGLIPMSSKAQTSNVKGPELDLNEMSESYILEDNDDFMRIFSQKRAWTYDDVVITKYNKQTREITEQAVDDDYEGRFVFLTDDNTTANVVRFVTNKKTQMMEYQKASFPLDVKVPKKLVFTPFYSFPLGEKNKSYNTKAIYNADKSKFAIVSTSSTGKNKQVIIDVAVFDNAANLLYHDSKELEPFPNSFSKEMVMSLDGTVYLILSGGETLYRSYENGIRIITCSEHHGIFDYKETLETDISISCKPMLKPKGDLCVMGFWTPKGDQMYKFRTYTATPEGETDFVEQEIALSANFDGGSYYNDPFAKQKGSFSPSVFDMIELQNGNFLLVGGMKSKVQVGTQGDFNAPLYGILSHDIFCLFVDPDGNVKDLKVFPRMTVTCDELTMRWANSDPVYAFERDGDVYMIYNDNRNNYKGEEKVHCLFFNLPDQCSVVLSKIENSGELSSTILYNAKTKIRDPRVIAHLYNFECLYKLLHSAEDGVYYILNRDDEFHLEKIEF